MTNRLDENAAIVLRALGWRPHSRADLVQATGWSRNTVAARLNELMAAGWVNEIHEAQGERGRPYMRYRLNPRASLVYAASFGWDQINGAVCGLDGEVIATDLVSFPLGSLQDAIKMAEGQLADLRTHPAVANQQISSAVIGIPSPVANPVQLAAWSHVGVLPSDFARSLGVPVLIENDANLMALGLRRYFPNVRSFVFLKIATGIGAGIVIDGHLHTGVVGLAGEVGHIPVRRADGRQCTCGNRGCLAEVGSVPAILRDLSSEARQVRTLDELHALVSGGDGEAVALLRAAGRDIGEALVGVVTGIAPELIILGGRVTEIGDHLATGVREAITQLTFPALSSRLRVETTSNHRIAGLRGAADLTFDHLVSPNPARPGSSEAVVPNGTPRTRLLSGANPDGGFGLPAAP